MRSIHENRLKRGFAKLLEKFTIVTNLIFNAYYINTLRSSRALRCLILFTAEGAKVAKTSLKRLVFNYKFNTYGFAIPEHHLTRGVAL